MNTSRQPTNIIPRQPLCMLPDEMISTIAMFLPKNDQNSFSETSKMNARIRRVSSIALRKRRSIEKNKIENLLKSNINEFIQTGYDLQKCRIFRFNLLSRYLAEFGLYDDSAVSDAGCFEKKGLFVTDDTEYHLRSLLEAGIAFNPEKAYSMSMAMVKLCGIKPSSLDFYNYHLAGLSAGSINIPECDYENVVRYRGDLECVILGDNVATIGNVAFYKFRKLSTIVIPDSVIFIGSDAFGKCSSLKSIVIPDSVLEIEMSAFSHCTNLSSIVLSNSLTRLETYLFQNCKKLKSIVIPESVTTIGKRVFSDCWSLESVIIPDSVTEIEDGAFEYCMNLESVIVSDSVKYGDLVFKGCPKLEIEIRT